MPREKLFLDILDENFSVKTISQAFVVLIGLAEAELGDNGSLYYPPHRRTIEMSITKAKKYLKIYNKIRDKKNVRS